MKLRDIFDELNSLVSGGRVHAIPPFLNSMGARRIGSGSFSYCYSLECGWGAVAIKISYTEYPVNALDAEDRFRFPLLWRRYLKPLFRSQAVVIQPLVQGEESFRGNPWHRFNRANRVLCRWFEKLYQTDFDAHGANVGYYRGKLVIFDPLTPTRRLEAKELVGCSTAHKRIAESFLY